MKKFTILLLVFLFSCKEKVEERKKDINIKGAFSVILIKKDLSNLEKSKERIEKIYKDLQEKRITFEEGVNFADNDDLNKMREGFIGIHRFGYFPYPLSEDLEGKIFSLKEDEFSEIIDLPFHYGIFKKEKILEKGLNHILVSWKGALFCPLAIQRTKEQAFKMVEEAYNLLKNGTPFEEVAKKYSNGLEAKRGGYLGFLSPKALFPIHRKYVVDLEFNQISPIIESPLGFHIYQIVEPLPDTIGIKHIMISYQGALMAPFTITRSKEEAKELAESLRKRLISGEDFNLLAKKYSNDKSTYKKGGDLGIICLDKFIPVELEGVAFKLKVNEISPVVESPGGFHIILRYK